MTLTQHVSYDFVTMKVADKTIFGEKVYTQLLANAATFIGLPHAPAAVQAANTDLANKTAAADNGDKTAIDNRDASEKAWIKIFKENAKLVDNTANGDKTIIDKSGYNATKANSEHTVAPTSLTNHQTSVDGMTNAIKSSVDADTNIAAFVHFAKTANVQVQQMGNQLNFTVGTEKINIVFDTHRSVVINGLASHVAVQVQAMGINLAGASQLTNARTNSPQ